MTHQIFSAVELCGFVVVVQHFSKFLQHPVARVKTMPSNQIAE